MIATVLGPIEPSSVAGGCSPHERLLQQTSLSDIKDIHDTPITLLNLGDARRHPDYLAASNRLFSPDESVQELVALVDAGGALVLACSTVEEGRDPAGLADISRRSGVRVVMGASWGGDSPTTSQSTAETIGRKLEHQLLFGENVESAGAISRTTLAPASSRVQAGFLVVRLDQDASNGAPAAAPSESSGISGRTTRALEGAEWAQRATGAPLLIICSHFIGWRCLESAVAIATVHRSDGLTAVGKVIVAGMHGGSSQAFPDQVALLQKGVVLCFDCFGRVEWLAGPEYYPSDEESAVRIAELVRQGFAGQIVISQGVSRRIHLSRCGGYGYGHALRSVPPRLQRLGVSSDDIALITRGNVLRLLDWYTPPPPPEIPKDYLPCSWCKAKFEPIEGEYFHKFRFVYCGIKCLRLHRDTGFDAAQAGGE